MKRMFFANAGAATLLLALFTPLQMHATVILEGSDAVTFHCGAVGSASSGPCVYAGEVWKALDGSSSLPIAVIQGSIPVALNAEGTGITIDNFSSVAAAMAAGGGSLSGYAALYFEGDGGDNEGPEGDTAIGAVGAQSAVSTYLAGGGTIMIEDYSGGSAWDFAFGGTGSYNSAVAGAFGGAPTTSGCTDNETVTATGTANGFTQPPVIGCWQHQAYNESVFGALGFTKSFFDSAPDMVGGATTGWSSLLSNGTTLSAATPEPSSIGVLSGFLLLGIGAIRRRKARQ